MRIVVASPMLVATFTKKKCILVIFGMFKKRNPRAVGFFRRILDRNVVVADRLSKSALSFPQGKGSVKEYFENHLVSQDTFQLF